MQREKNKSYRTPEPSSVFPNIIQVETLWSSNRILRVPIAIRQSRFGVSICWPASLSNP